MMSPYLLKAAVTYKHGKIRNDSFHHNLDSSGHIEKESAMTA